MRSALDARKSDCVCVCCVEDGPVESGSQFAFSKEEEPGDLLVDGALCLLASQLLLHSPTGKPEPHSATQETKGGKDVVAAD